MAGFVDIHSHVLYGLDDGARTEDDSVAMLDLAAASGTVAIVATPHANSQYEFRPDLVEARIAGLQARTSLQIYPGCDLHLNPANVTEAVVDPEKYSINHGVYLLVEFPEMGAFPAADGVLRELLEAGLVPVISHPERNEYLRSQFDDLTRWVSDGCCLQATAGSFTGAFGAEAQRAAEDLLARGLLHLVASDGHNVRTRPPVLRDAFEQLCARWGEDVVRPLFVENPAAVVASETLPYEPVILRDRKRWYQIWK